MAQSTVYLISGAGRGIGFAITEQLATRPNTIIYAGIRSFPPKAGSDLANLVSKFPGVVIPIELSSGGEADNKAAAAEITQKVGKLDVVIANAGASSGPAPVLATKGEDILDLLKINTIGPLVLFQATESLLSKSTAPAGKFAIVSSALGLITDALPYPFLPYGLSKAAVNYVAKKISQEHANIITFPLHPGAVSTDMGKEGAAQIGVSLEAFGAITPEASAAGVLKLIDEATLETSGKFWDIDGTQKPF